MSLLPQVEGYVVTEYLGKGSYATVYKAYRRDQSREAVAIKCVLKSSLTKSAIENLLTEIKILKSVKHEYIVEMKDFQWDDTCIYLIFEYCSGGDLSQFIRKKRQLPESVVQLFLQQLAKALQVLRSHNISHMDLKPQNILLSCHHNPILKLGDFGFAQYLHPGSEGCSMRGSPLYMAPEILLHHHYDARVDLWSIGIILYECLFGQAPFQSNTFSKLAEKIKSSNPIELPYKAEVSKECRHLLLGLLNRDPNKRLSFEDFFSHSFVDLEHMPSTDSYAKGVSLVQQAVNEDKIGNYPKSVSLYSQALEYLLPHVPCESDHYKRKEFRKKLFEYVNRAEELKTLCATSFQEHEKSQNVFLGQLLLERPLLQDAVCLAQEADTLVIQNNYEAALSLYQQALEIMVPYVSKEPIGKSKELLYFEVDQWMKKAEELKRFVQFVKQKNKLDTYNSDDQRPNLSNTLSCVIQ